jgi:chemotaxis protein methyltransferase CheR
MTDPTFSVLQRLVHDRSGMVLEKDQAPRLEACLADAARSWGYTSPSALLSFVQKNPEGPEAWQLSDMLMPKETYFFRDPLVFEGLDHLILPELIDRRRHDQRLSIWFAACSSGQEPYSVVLMMEDHFPELRGWDLEILATDLSEPMLRKAEEGVYTQFEVNRGLPALYLVRYFEEVKGGWRIKPALRQRVRFKHLNLLDPWGWGRRFDLIVARNVLYYFDDAAKKEIYRKFAEALDPHGILVLGTAETPLFLAPQFVPLTDNPSLGYRLKPEGTPQGKGNL